MQTFTIVFYYPLCVPCIPPHTSYLAPVNYLCSVSHLCAGTIALCSMMSNRIDYMYNHHLKVFWNCYHELGKISVRVLYPGKAKTVFSDDTTLAT